MFMTYLPPSKVISLVHSMLRLMMTRKKSIGSTVPCAFRLNLMCVWGDENTQSVLQCIDMDEQIIMARQ